MSGFDLTDKEFKRFQSFIYDEAGISISEGKKQLVLNRLSKRLRHYSLQNFEDYLTIVHTDKSSNEKQTLIDLLTTNETYFFREEKHFEFIKSTILSTFRGGKLNCWSAACSNGAEPYSLAMLFQNELGTGRWGILATDISSKVIGIAKEGVYDINVADKIPREYLIKYCLKGVRSKNGVLMIDPSISKHIKYCRMNLNGGIPVKDKFDLIMLRNIMIYFNHETKVKLIRDMIATLHPGGYLIIGHSESLNGVTQKLKMVKPSIYRLPQ